MKTFIDFPLEDLDISQFLSKSSPNISQQLINYDLFAVSNHYGELEFGHYNANCLNYMDNQWYNFNDRKVEIIEGNNPELIVTKDAYVLFYRQKNMKNINWVDIYKKQFMDIKDDNFFDNLYKDFSIQRVFASRMINSKSSGRGNISEILISNY